ncbi:MAG: 1-deoxy-D-xylulose-5-phosphate reductoisomerase [Phycisphaerae bacterium]|nr:1-deoxy-D-xylulose-5-phosphate reductoisomerase [Phycisphaerae bacterium]MDD5381534.1 1-deoxy-D-xylulose-5-phosphate reductoisomerase [Phycisphaerae bacterium]
MVKRIAILGSTGSIGKNALRVIDSLGAGYEVVALSAHSRVELLAEQVRRYKPKFAAITNADFADELRGLVSDLEVDPALQKGGVEVLAGPEGLAEIAQLEEVDIVLTAVVGAAGLPAVLSAAKAGKTLAIANKEPLVIAGELLMQTVKASGGLILPVDSEHSAIFQAMQAGKHGEVSKIILTSSGGPFRKSSPEEIENVTLEQALSHPVWDMGPKITVDSATMMNKALEVIEAHWLFDMPVDKIEVLIHPESIVHSLVEFVDGSMMAQLGKPDMCLPIQYALTYPARVAGIAEHLQLDELGRLTFEKPNMETFRALSLGFEVARTGGTAAVVFNAANEAAVGEFLAGRIKFARIVELIEHCLNKHDVKRRVSLEELFEADSWARKEVERRAQEHKSVIS